MSKLSKGSKGRRFKSFRVAFTSFIVQGYRIIFSLGSLGYLTIVSALDQPFLFIYFFVFGRIALVT